MSAVILSCGTSENPNALVRASSGYNSGGLLGAIGASTTDNSIPPSTSNRSTVKTTRIIPDGMGGKTVMDSDGHWTRYRMDGMGGQTVSDSEGHTTRYQRDLMGGWTISQY